MAERVQKTEGDKKSSKKLMIVSAALIVVLAGGAGGYLFLTDDTEDASEVEESVPETAAPVEFFYYDLSKPLIVNFSSGSTMRLMQVSISLLVDSQSAIDALNKHDPMIRNNLLMLLSAQNADELITREGKDKLREAVLSEVITILEKMTGKSYVTEVFFTSFVMQ